MSNNRLEPHQASTECVLAGDISTLQVNMEVLLHDAVASQLRSTSDRPGTTCTSTAGASFHTTAGRCLAMQQYTLR